MTARLTSESVRRALRGAPPAQPSRRSALAHGALPAAVLLPIVLEAEPWVVAIVRAAAAREHAGEVAFPGGKPEPEDASLERTALREAHEEIALDPSAVQTVGLLEPVPVITGRYLIFPFVAVATSAAGLRAQEGEVAEIVRLPLMDWLLRGRTIEGYAYTVAGGEGIVPHFELGEHVLYGASAIIFFELLEKLAKELGARLPEPRLQSEAPWARRYGLS